jgi:hypothetical protein
MRTPNLLQSYRNRRPINPKISYTKAENISKIRKSAEVGTSKKRKIEEGLLSEPEENLSDTPKKLDPVNVTKKKPKPVSVEKRQSISAGKSPIMNSNDSNGPTLHVTSVTESLMKEFQAELQATANQQKLLLQVSPTRYRCTTRKP